MDRELVAQTWSSWLRERGFMPMSFVTLTFDPKRWPRVDPEVAFGLWKWLADRMATSIGGRNYRRRWKHTPFSYVVGIDYHKSGDVHMHAVIDGWIPFRLARLAWNQRCGFLDVDEIRNAEELQRALDHIVRYVMKADSAPMLWINRSPVRTELRTAFLARSAALVVPVKAQLVLPGLLPSAPDGSSPGRLAVVP